MELRFRKCTTQDLEELLRISRKTFIDAFEAVNEPEDFWAYMDKAFSRESLTEQLNNKNVHFYFAFLNDELTGYFKLNEAGAQTDINDKDSIEIERIYVLEEHQGKRLGQRFLEEITAIAKRKNAGYLWLGVWEHNTGAIRFYERYGFEKSGTHAYVLGNDVQTDWLMKKEV